MVGCAGGVGRCTALDAPSNPEVIKGKVSGMAGPTI